MDMPDLYCLKYRQKGTKKWKYGKMRKFDERAESHWNDHKCILVEDAIMPKIFALPYDDFEIVGLEHDMEKRTHEYYDFLDAELEKAMKKSYAIKKGYKGKMFSIQHEAGTAHYIVTKESKDTLTVEYRCYDPDEWIDRVLGMGGKFPKENIVELIKGCEFWIKMSEERKGV